MTELATDEAIRRMILEFQAESECQRLGYREGFRSAALRELSRRSSRYSALWGSWLSVICARRWYLRWLILALRGGIVLYERFPRGIVFDDMNASPTVFCALCRVQLIGMVGESKEAFAKRVKSFGWTRYPIFRCRGCTERYKGRSA